MEDENRRFTTRSLHPLFSEKPQIVDVQVISIAHEVCWEVVLLP